MVEVGGGMTIIILVPFLVFMVGIVFVGIAAKDGRGRADHRSVTDLSTRANHPLRHVQIALNEATKQARDAARQKEPEPERKRAHRPRWLRRV
jgi:hypothetical protein